MARISTYIKDTGLTDKDLLVGSNYVSGGSGQEKYTTANFTLDAVKSYIGATGGDSTFLKESNTTLTPAQLISLNGGGSIELIAAPGVNKVIDIIRYAAFLDFNTTAYNFTSASEGIGFFYDGGSIPIYGTAGRLNATSDLVFNSNVSSSTANSALANASIVFKSIASTTVTQGDSPLKINILYRIVDFS